VAHTEAAYEGYSLQVRQSQTADRLLVLDNSSLKTTNI